MKNEAEEEKLLLLIGDYIKCSSYLVKLIKDNFNINEEGILRSLRLNLLPNKGQINNVEFNFHGGGCFFELEKDSIDVDFGPDDRSDGFDLHRLKEFCNNRLDKYPEFGNEIKLKEVFDRLVEKKIIVNPKLYPNPHLFYLT